ncbi:anticodon-binding domain-containing protein [Globomyces pollinis-pini]|nr:anticodon-binding domain-containing protein [Globomyces pollinis-pini]
MERYDNLVSRATGTSSQDPSAAVGVCVNLSYRVNGQVVSLSGIVFCLDPVAGVVLLQLPDSLDISLIRLSALVDCRISQKPFNCTPISLKHEPSLISNRIKDAVKKQLELNMKIGVGVSNEAQMLFNELTKTMSVKWKDTSIIVMESVMINEPYTSRVCQLLKKGDTAALERVKKVVDAVRHKLRL